ncbi:hypothetical protein FPQ18DRAFT_317021 [Pyronema domesticum]|uniref:Similar to NASP-related protein sim3 acc. no. Q9USQ4 n=1 Tax=Pyronema omphalodes (strain CBS 100304) TaxID=1076935 RepID=U4LBR5_PYROM|nr:hypothetical protein FPQ18DRAFT_317021 [Pyronema domesticum]CCX07747.1 Similar to NASP-related protein sim3; acc. no. Q9USQ4 [Pyronema omphalodes CBS 100304]
MSAANDEKRNELEALKARAVKAYATKDFPQSVDIYGEACQLQSEIQGEDNPANAQLLYLYGRALYRVAIDKNDVLGAPTDKADKEKEQSAKGRRDLASVSEEPEEKADKLAQAKKAAGLFQFHGDGEYDESDEEDEDEEGGEGEDDDDDMAAAWSVLDLARVMFEKQIAADETDKKWTNEEAKEVKTMLADVYDLLGEVSLESENFFQATKDFDSSLTLKEELCPLESNLISEAHFKMSLALEYSSTGEGISKDDEKKLRNAAAEHIDKAIDSCKARKAIEEAARELADKGKGKAAASEASKDKQIDEIDEIIAELEQRAEDLRNPPPPTQLEQDEQLQGLLGQILGEGKDPMLAKQALEQAMAGANDLSGMVRKKAKPAKEEGSASSSSAKRKLDDAEEEGADKKAKVDDA